MVWARGHHRYTYADYVAVELESSVKHEFLDGEIYAMAGGSEDHSALSAQILRALGNAIGDRPCRAHTSDLRLYVEAVGLATFPDGGGRVTVESLSVELVVDEIYRGSNVR